MNLEISLIMLQVIRQWLLNIATISAGLKILNMLRFNTSKLKFNIIFLLILYFAFIYSYQCFCDNSYGFYGRADESACNLECRGDPSEICGGSWKNSVYNSTQSMHFLCFDYTVTKIFIFLVSTTSLDINCPFLVTRNTMFTCNLTASSNQSNFKVNVDFADGTPIQNYTLANSSISFKHSYSLSGIYIVSVSVQNTKLYLNPLITSKEKFPLNKGLLFYSDFFFWFRFRINVQ